MRLETTEIADIKLKAEEKEEKEEEETKVNVTSKKENDIKVEPVDWKPPDKCYFCVDGKLLKVNEAGELVAESGPVPTESDLTNRVSFRIISNKGGDRNNVNINKFCTLGLHSRFRK